MKKDNGKIGTKTNFSGGIQGGISNGENIYFNVAFKPPSTISKEQNTKPLISEEAYKIYEISYILSLIIVVTI